MNLRAKIIYILLSLSILFAIVSAVITYYNTREKRESMNMVIRRYQSIASAEQLLSYLKDMEAGQRGYVISGDSEFLKPFNEARLVIKQEQDTLQQLFAHDEQQTSLIENQLLAVVNSKVKEMENTIHVANRFGKDSASVRVNDKIEKAYMDTLRTLVGALMQGEKKVLADNNRRLERNTMVEDTVRFFAFVLIGATSVAALIALIKRQQEVNTLLTSLEKTNESLETKVQERTADLVKANADKDHFLGIASHDLKVPLTGVVGLIRLMKDGDVQRTKTEAEYLEYIEQSCIGMQDLINNLLDINRIERGEARIHKSVVDLYPLLEKLRMVFEPMAQKKMIKLVIVPCHLSLTTDATSLNRILENLLSNAIKFTKAGKTVELKVHQNNTSTTFEVLDEGLGIPQHEVPDLFKRFHRFSNKPTGSESSTGLGLAITKDLTTLLGGHISVVSLVGEGSQFIVSLPNE